MRSIPLIDVDDTEVFDEITAAKRGQRRVRLTAARPAVLEAYERYDDATPELGNLAHAALTVSQKEALNHAFNVETAPMTEMRGSILKRISVARCPFCGISESSTLDHYLPKEQYPEFSVFSLNLVPCCSPCNTRKRDKILDDDTEVRLFVHPHFDQIPTTLFLAADIDLQANAIVLGFRVTRPAGMALASFQHLRSHFRLLDLADRYRRMALEHLGGQYRALKRAYGPGEDAERVASELALAAEDFEERYGENYWLAVLYRALAAHDDFCDGGFEALRALQ
jgi:5-methylcytosine-specific restriction endonuclease McrA